MKRLLLLIIMHHSLYSMSKPHALTYYAIKTSPLGNYTLSYRNVPYSPYSIIDIYNAHTHQLLFSKETTSSCLNKFSVDDKYLAIVKDKTIEIIQSETGKSLCNIFPHLPPAKPEDFAFISVVQSKLAYVDCDKEGFHIKIMDFIKKELIAQLKGSGIESQTNFILS